MINCSTSLICKTSKSAHTTPLVALLFDLNWLPFSNRILYKTALTCFHTVSGTAPPYLSELFHLSYSPFRSSLSPGYSDLPCSEDGKEDPKGEILSKNVGPVLWNSLSVRTPLHFFQAEHPPLLFCILICL